MRLCLIMEELVLSHSIWLTMGRGGGRELVSLWLLIRSCKILLVGTWPILWILTKRRE